MTEAQEFMIVIRTVPSRVPAIIRLRQFGFRVVAIADQPAAGT